MVGINIAVHSARSCSGTKGISLHGVVRLVAIINLAYFGIEFAVARIIGSVLLFADSIDFLEDASVKLLIFVSLGWTARHSMLGSSDTDATTERG
jgi:Co/Zn/Cd efflux system component